MSDSQDQKVDTSADDTSSKNIDKLLNDVFSPFSLLMGTGLKSTDFSARTDCHENNDGSLCIRMDVPGFNPEDLKVEVNKGKLAVSGYRTVDRTSKGTNRSFYERRSGSFKRTFILPNGADLESISSSLTNGVLTVMVPPPVQASRVVKITSQ